ncbi:hypothetical protein MRB53_027431 [Persea americana]|uniref:Uncharacterized protein n=1 Tax=Persea americana TaxID=3435 RepID=A0ACC2LKV9_PERAE|nr:hypothetical protein MRB53_027431 [Persea americana]
MKPFRPPINTQAFLLIPSHRFGFYFRCSNLEMIGQVLEFGDDLGFRRRSDSEGMIGGRLFILQEGEVVPKGLGYLS